MTAFAFLVCCPVVRAAAETTCRTPSGVPCHTLHVETSNWQFGGLLDIQHSTRVRTRAVRSDGSVAVREERSKGIWDWHPAETGRIYFSGTDQVVRWNAADRTWSERAAMAWADRPSPGGGNCAKVEPGYGLSYKYAGTETIAGLRAVEMKAQSGGAEIRIWKAPALGCAAVRVEVTIRDRFLPASIQRAVVTSVEWGEPKAELFNYPSDYWRVEDPSLPFVRSMKEAEMSAGQSRKLVHFLAAGPPEEWTTFNTLQ